MTDYVYMYNCCNMYMYVRMWIHIASFSRCSLEFYSIVGSEVLNLRLDLCARSKVVAKEYNCAHARARPCVVDGSRLDPDNASEISCARVRFVLRDTATLMRFVGRHNSNNAMLY